MVVCYLWLHYIVALKLVATTSCRMTREKFKDLSSILLAAVIGNVTISRTKINVLPH